MLKSVLDHLPALVEGVATNLLAAIVSFFFQFGLRRFITEKFGRNPRLAMHQRLGLRIAVYAIIFLIARHCFYLNEWICETSLLVFVLADCWFTVRQLAAVGLWSIDTRISSGIDYSTSLGMTKNGLSLMGTGGYKLTVRGEEFIEALKRASSPERPARFLLVHPHNKSLLDAAKRHEKDGGDRYKQRVLASLRVLNDLRRNKACDIDIRFYSAEPDSEPPIFRMMLINGTDCLVSYNIYGRGTGENHPQLHFRSFAGSGRDATLSFYDAFERYFNRLWKDAVVCDLETILKSDAA